VAKTLIVIPAYNCEEAVSLSLESSVNQTICTDIVVVDNYSTDGTRDVVKKYAAKHSNVKLIVNEMNLGRVGNLNRCLDVFKKNRHEYIKFLFTGDEMKPDCIQECEKIFTQYADLGAVFWPYEFKHEGNISISRDYNESRYLPPNEINELNIAEGGRLGAIVCNAYSKKAIVASGAYFNDVFIGKSDFDYRVLQNHGVYYLNKVLSTFNVEHHRTFQYALDNYRINIEASFNGACALERIRNTLPFEKYKSLKSRVIINIFRRNINFLKPKDFIALLRLVGMTTMRYLTKPVRKRRK